VPHSPRLFRPHCPTSLFWPKIVCEEVLAQQFAWSKTCSDPGVVRGKLTVGECPFGWPVRWTIQCAALFDALCLEYLPIWAKLATWRLSVPLQRFLSSDKHMHSAEPAD
jgi:hypothetical protein